MFAKLAVSALFVGSLALAGPAYAQTISHELDHAASCVVVGRTLAASGQLTEAQTARAKLIYQTALAVQNRQIGANGYSSSEASQIKSFYADKLAKPLRGLAALKQAEANDVILGLCAEFG